MSQQVNLFNPVFLKEKKHFSATTMGQALVIIVVFILALFAFARYQTWRLDQEASRVAAQLKEAQRQLATLAGYAARKKNPLLEDKVTQMQRDVVALKQAFVRLRSDKIGTQQGYSDYLRAFASQIVQGVWLTGFSIEGAGNAMGLQGAALKPELVPLYMNRLKRESVLQGKAFATFEIRQPKEETPKAGDKAGDKARQAAGATALSYVEFDLRSEGVAKADETAFASGAGAGSIGGRSQ